MLFRSSVGLGWSVLQRPARKIERIFRTAEDVQARLAGSVLRKKERLAAIRPVQCWPKNAAEMPDSSRNGDVIYRFLRITEHNDEPSDSKRISFHRSNVRAQRISARF